MPAGREKIIFPVANYAQRRWHPLVRLYTPIRFISRSWNTSAVPGGTGKFPWEKLLASEAYTLDSIVRNDFPQK